MSVTTKQDPAATRHAALFGALVPGITGLVLWSPDLARRSSWGDAPATLDALLQAAGWTASPVSPAPIPLDAAGNGLAGLAWPLVADSGRFVGAFALLWPADRRPEFDTVAPRVAPALDCLRMEVASAQARQLAADLQWQQAVGEWYQDIDVRATVESILAVGLKRTGSQAAMLYVPSLGLEFQSRDAKPAPEVVSALQGLRATLDGLTAPLSRYAVVAGGPTSPPMLVIPTRCCGGRVAVLLAFLMSSQGPGFGGQTLQRAHGVAFAATRRVDVTLDDETGLLSRTGLDEARQHLAVGAGALLLVDIDRHHSVNTVHGLDAGDMLLREVAGLFRQPLIPPGSLPARLHGGCFALLLPGKDAAAAAAIGQALQAALAARNLRWGGESIDAGISCGVTALYDVSWPLDPAFSAADLVLRLAKERGRGRVEISETGDSTIIRRHDEILAGAELREALGSHRLMLFAQKIVPLGDARQTAGFELLVRMRDRITGATIPPKDFIAAAQRYGMLQDVDRSVVDEAFRIIAAQRDVLGRLTATFSINVSGASVGDSEFVDYFLRRLREAQLPASRITLEITEQAAVAKLDRAAEMMRRLREAGCGIAIDDFGTGANSMAYLRALPLTRLKIDGSFVKDMLTNPRSEAAVRGMVEMAKNFKLETVAEFVEDSATSERLRKMGIDYGQGYLYGKPEPMEAAIVELGRGAASELSDILNPR